MGELFGSSAAPPVDVLPSMIPSFGPVGALTAPSADGGSARLKGVEALAVSCMLAVEVAGTDGSSLTWTAELGRAGAVEDDMVNDG